MPNPFQPCRFVFPIDIYLDRILIPQQPMTDFWSHSDHINPKPTKKKTHQQGRVGSAQGPVVTWNRTKGPCSIVRWHPFAWNGIPMFFQRCHGVVLPVGEWINADYILGRTPLLEIGVLFRHFSWERKALKQNVWSVFWNCVCCSALSALCRGFAPHICLCHDCHVIFPNIVHLNVGSRKH